MKRIVCVWFPDWPLQRVVAGRTELRGKPLVLYETVGGRGQRVVVCSAAARVGGVRAGMSLSEAVMLLKRGESRENRLECHPSDPSADREALIKVAESCHRYSPLVGLEESSRPESLLLDITGLGPLFGGEQALVCRVADDWMRQGYCLRVAAADTIGAAWAVAHYGMDSGRAAGEEKSHEDFGRPLPKAGFRGETSSAVRMVSPEDHPAVLAALPVEALRLPQETVWRLGQLGIVTVAQLLALPRKELRSRFGDRLLERIDQVFGSAPELILARRPAAKWSVRWQLESPVARRDAVEQVVEALIGRLAGELAERNQGALRLICWFVCPPAQNVTLEVGLFQPSARADHLSQLAGLQLERLRLPAPVIEVRVEATATAPLVDRQKRLFPDDRPQAVASQIAPLVERLTARLGRRAVLRTWPTADAQPERAYRTEPWLQPARTGKPPANRPAAGPLERPLWLVSPPKRLEVVSIVPDGPPLQFRLSGQSHNVARHWGPERIETGWWRSSPVRRDYYRVETSSGSRFWLFRRLHDGLWFLQGEFA